MISYNRKMLQRLKLKTELDGQDVYVEDLVKEIPPSFYQTHSMKEKLSSKIILKNRRPQVKDQPSRSKRTSLADRMISDRSPQQRNTNNQLFEEIFNENSEIRVIPPKGKNGSKKTKTSNNMNQEMRDEEEELKNHDHFQHSGVLKDIIRKYKIKSIVQNFVKKIKRVSVLKDPVEYSVLDQYEKSLLWKKSGYELPQLAENVITLVSIFQIICFSFVLSITLVYSELQENMYITDFQTLTLLILIIQILINLTTVKHHSGKKIQTLIEIWEFYLKGYLIIDILGVVILVCNIFTSSPQLNYLKIIILLKIPQCVDKTQKLEVYFIKNLYNQQYWSLIKILLFNFSCAHIISILLTAMACLSPGHNWMTIKNLQFSPWYEKYSWSYYWANTIMLTVGFGDFVANNYKQAICIVFIQTFSCMAFAYNINCIGSIIQQIRAKDSERSQKSKIFTKLNDKNKLSQDLSYKISNYIEETARLRKNFNYDEQRDFITNLPGEMKKQYLKQSNKNIFENINFFKSFISKTLYNMAEKIEMKVSHPEETIQHLYDDYNLMILKTGKLGFVCKRPNSDMAQFVMDSKVIKEKDNPYLVNLDFITRKRSNYEIKSIEYAIFYFLPYDKFIEVLRETEMDYEFFCTLRDRMKSIPDQFEVFQCEVCKGKHLKALCPKLHYIPYQQNIIHKYLRIEKTHSNCRTGFGREFKDVKYQKAFCVYRKSIENVERLSNLVQSQRRQKTVADVSQKSEVLESDGHPFLSETEMERELKQITQQYKNVTMQILKQEITKLIKTDNLEDEVWLLKSDVLQDYNAYFHEHNPSNISNRYLQMVELFKSENVLKTHTSAMLQNVKNARQTSKHYSNNYKKTSNNMRKTHIY